MTYDQRFVQKRGPETPEMPRMPEKAIVDFKIIQNQVAS